MTKILNLEKLWEVCNILSNKESELSEENCYISLLGMNSDYSDTDFDHFLRYYSFKVEDENIVVYNSDSIPYESWNNEDYSYVPFSLLDCGEKDLEKWIEEEVTKQLEQQEKDKIAEKEELKRQIEILTKRLKKAV